MKFKQVGWFREWECCGVIWQLLLSRLFPERDSWSPKCPKCGDEMTSDEMGYKNKTTEVGICIRWQTRK
jgi:hypothetical protein